MSDYLVANHVALCVIMHLLECVFFKMCCTRLLICGSVVKLAPLTGEPFDIQTY